MKIVIIEDDIAIGFSLRMALEDRGHEVEIFDDPTKVPYDTLHADVILLDFYMPQMDGTMVLQKLRAMPGPRQSRVILMSASTQMIERAEELKVEYLAKPFDLSALYARIEETR